MLVVSFMGTPSRSSGDSSQQYNNSTHSSPPLRGTFTYAMLGDLIWPISAHAPRIPVWSQDPTSLQPTASRLSLRVLLSGTVPRCNWNYGYWLRRHILTSNATNLSTLFNSCMYPSVLVGDGKSIPVTNTGHSTLPTPYRPLHLNNTLLAFFRYVYDGCTVLGALESVLHESQSCWGLQYLTFTRPDISFAVQSLGLWLGAPLHACLPRLLCFWNILDFVPGLQRAKFTFLASSAEAELGVANAVYGEDEWSFGFCEEGSGVFSCPSGKNPMYTYRECIVLGRTDLTKSKFNQILRDLSREWPGDCYDLLSKNCNHFCDEFCEILGVQKLPGWVNRFANAGDTAVEIAGNTAYRFRQAKTEIVTASKVAYQFLAGIASNNNTTAATESTNGSSNGSTTPRFQQPAWFKNLVAAGAKPSTSNTLENGEEDFTHNLSTEIPR
ncbi:deSI-like protein [Tanacetum coccineum]